MMALRCSCIARSSSESSSTFCSATVRPGLDGQSMFATVATHAPRNSRGGDGGVKETGWKFSPAANSSAGSSQRNANKIPDRNFIELRLQFNRKYLMAKFIRQKTLYSCGI